MKYLTAKDIMNTDVISVRSDMTVQETASFLTGREILGAPVVDAMGEVVGVVSCTDIAQTATSKAQDRSQERSGSDFYGGWEENTGSGAMKQLQAETANLPVGEIMTPTVYTVPQETPIPDIARTMVAGRIHRLLVTRGSQLVGIITTLDLLRVLFDE